MPTPPHSKSERTGTVLIVIVALFWGMFPIVVNKGSQNIPPLFFAAISTLVGFFTVTALSIVRGSFSKALTKDALKYGLAIGLLNGAIPYSLMFIGSHLTSGINTAALSLSEIIFTLLITPFFGEKPTTYKTLGGGLVLIGAFLILFKGATEINLGDILVIFSTLTLPFGNYFGKKALAKNITGETIMTIRYAVAAILLLALSLLFEDRTNFISTSLSYWPYILINGVILMGFANSLWYHGLKKIEVSKAVSLLMTYPFFSLIFLVTFFGERPSIYQLTGLVIIVLGGVLSARIQKN